MKICIYGAGAIGGYLGVLLKQAGADVSLIAFEPAAVKTSASFCTRGVSARVGLPVLPEIRNDIWLKHWGNLCFNRISALTHATLDKVATEPGTRNLSRNMMLEAEKIGRRIGVHFRVDVDRRIDGAARVGAHKTSMLQDVEKGRPLEIDALLTCVQELGRLAEVDTPHIDARARAADGSQQGPLSRLPDLPAAEESLAVD